MGKKKSKKSTTTTTTTTTNTTTETTSSSTENIFDPLKNLNEDQLNIFNQFTEKIKELTLTDREKEWIDNLLICRYLRAREFDLTASFELFLGTLEWRKSFKPYELSAEDLAYESSTGKSYVYGKSIDGRSVIYLTPSRENTKNYEKQIKLLVYNIERAISYMDKSKGHEQLILMIDFKNYSLSYAPPMSVSKQTLDILSSHYPERLGMAILVDAPIIFNIFLKAISPFINKNTYKKINFANGKNKSKLFTENFDMDTIAKEYGGNSDFEFNHTVFWSNEIKLSRKERNLPELSDAEILELVVKKDE